MALELEDDVFFADLSKQIALLIMDDDDGSEFPVQRPSLVPLQVLECVVEPNSWNFNNRTKSFPAYGPQVVMTSSLPYQLMACRGESKGTGVFIPRSSCSRSRRNRSSGRSATINTNNNSRNNKGVPQRQQ